MKQILLMIAVAIGQYVLTTRQGTRVRK